MPSLFDPIKLGAIHAPNRILMAPLTRGRATREHVPTELMQTYYAQRAAAGLIITEATGISREGLGWPYAPGIWNDGAGGGVEADHRGGARGGRADHAAAVAYGPGRPFELPRRRQAGLLLGDDRALQGAHL